MISRAVVCHGRAGQSCSFVAVFRSRSSVPDAAHAVLRRPRPGGTPVAAVFGSAAHRNRGNTTTVSTTAANANILIDKTSPPFRPPC